MTDRELLELAAKAVGIDLCWNDAEAPGYYSDFRGMPQWEYWNPLVFDGDALRLAVKLNLWEAVRLAHRQLGAPECPDLYAATRRAIVCAAAEIGKQAREKIIAP